MDQATETLLRDLAAELGTTVEYLWCALLRQAPISAVAEILLFTVWIILLLLAFKFIRAKTFAPTPTEDNKYPYPEWDSDQAFIAWLMWTAQFIILFLLAWIKLPLIIAALINPEFWALKQLLR